MRNQSVIIAVYLGCLSGLALASQLSREEVLRSVYPEGSFQAQRVFLTNSEKERAEELSGQRVRSALIARFLITDAENQSLGRAYVDTHTVRTKKESLLICLDRQGEVIRIEVTAFLEPPEYQAPAQWYAQYEGFDFDDEPRMHQEIQPLAGATLTAQAANEAVRRVLAIDQVLQDRRRENKG